MVAVLRALGILRGRQGREGHPAGKALVWLWFALLLLTPAATRADEKRVAFVIGNSKYRTATTLPNPVADASALQPILDRLNFEVVVGLNLTLSEFQEKLREFGRKMQKADLALLFYAGHGVQYEGRNYLLPIDIEMKSQAEVVQQSMPLNDILAEMGKHVKIGIVFLDACRDSPQIQTVSRSSSGGQTSPSAFVRGLAEVTMTTKDYFVGYAAAPGKTALDGTAGKNSPFTGALLRHVGSTGTDIGIMFSRVRNDVDKATGGRQSPEAQSGLSRQVFLNRTGIETFPGPPEVSMSTDAAVWLTIMHTGEAKDYEDFLREYPKSRFAKLAEKRLAELIKPTAATRPLLGGSEGAESGAARVTKEHPKVEAQRSAQAHARAKLIAKHFGMSASVPSRPVETTEQAAELLKYLALGVTYDEDWTALGGSETEVRFELRARVRPLRHESRRWLSGEIQPAALVSEQSFRLKITSRRDTTVAVFAWQGNGTVVRIYPDSSDREVRLKATESVTLPRYGDSYVALASMTMPGEPRNHEALIVLTGGSPIDLEKLGARAITDSPAESMIDTISGSTFLSRIAALPDPDLEMLVLPYVVRAKH